jgi:thiamine biosynthesis lipoprotein
MPKFAFEAIGTHWHIDINEPLSEEESDDLLGRIMARIEEFDKAYSRFRQDSLVTEMSRKAGTYVLSADAEHLFSMYKKFYDLTSGLLTPLIGNVLVDAGYDAEYSLKQKNNLSVPQTWDDMLTYSFPELTLKQPTLLDFGAAGKGYLVDIVSELIEAAGIENYCVDAGGDIRQRQKNASLDNYLRVGLEDPEDFSKAVGIVRLSNKSLCASAGNRRRWQDFHHIINPETLLSPKEISAVWTMAESTILADALSTGLYFAPAKTFAEHFSFEYLILNADSSVEVSQGFPAELFI